MTEPHPWCGVNAWRAHYVWRGDIRIPGTAAIEIMCFASSRQEAEALTEAELFHLTESPSSWHLQKLSERKLWVPMDPHED